MANAVSIAGNQIFLPRAQQDGGAYLTNYIVQNTTSLSTDVTANYYSSIGTLKFTVTYTLPPFGSRDSTGELPLDAFVGSIVLYSTHPIVAMMQESSPHTLGAYNGLVR